MLDYSQEELQRLGADITTREIYQQPEVWQEAFEHYKAQAADIAAFLKKIEDKHDYIKVIFAGAGSSAYVGDTLTPISGRFMMSANGISTPSRRQISLPIPWCI